MAILQRAPWRLFLPLLLCACDGTLTGIGRTPREPETPLPPAPVSSATAPGGSDPTQPEEPVDPTQRISAQHLLVSYKGARAAGEEIKRTREEARTRAEEALSRIRGGLGFDAAVVMFTDEPGGAARHGDLGSFTRDQMVKPFADAAFALKVGEVSPVVESPFGFHVIHRTE